MKRIILFIILTTSAICYGLNEIRVYYPSNYSVFSTVRNQSGQIWNGSAFEDFNDIYDCNIPMTDKLGGLYLGNFPSCDANSYTIMSYFDSDSTPDNNDVLIQFEEGYWTGTLWRSSRDRLEDIKADMNDIAVADIWNACVEGTYTYKDYIREIAAHIFGKFTGGNTANPSFYSPSDLSKLRSTFLIGTGTRTPTFIDPND